MKIAQLVNNFKKTTRTINNSIYSHTNLLSDSLFERGNEVTLFASGDSETKGRLFSVTEKNTSDMDINENTRKNLSMLLASKCYENAESFDIIHSHFVVISSFFSRLVKTPTVQSIHSPIVGETKIMLSRFLDNNYISFTLAQRKQMPELNWVGNIYHGVDLQEFRFNPHPQEYLLYLGRITEDKGPHLAIEAAKAAGVPLIIAGRSYEQEGYWHNKIEKHIDGKIVRYVGEADFEAKKGLLQNAKALLFPSQVEENFGLSMIESMACGTPVIAWNNGSVPEVVKDKKTGFIVNSVEGMVKAIGAIDKLSREESRKRAEVYFSVQKMVEGYEKVYLRVIEEARAKAAK